MKQTVIFEAWNGPFSAPGQPANRPKSTGQNSTCQAYNDAQQRRGGKGNTGAAGAQQAGLQLDPFFGS